MRVVITFGTFDLLHVGHLRILERAAALGDRLVVGISTDELNQSKKGYRPVFPFEQRAALVGALRVVDSTFAEHSLEAKRQYVEEQAADVMVMGADWEGRFDHLSDACQVVYLERTPGVSTSSLRRLLATGLKEW